MMGGMAAPSTTTSGHERQAAQPSAEVFGSIAGAPVLARFDKLCAFYAEGRKLTATG